jgi:hypothetical protein
MRAFLIAGFTLIVASLGGLAAPASAQILIWSLPEEDGTWVRFEGTYKQTRARPESTAGDEQLEWRSELTISSVGKETATVDGKELACRWVEFKTLTKPGGLDKEPGPGDLYVYKVLIPEERVIGKTVDDDTIPVTFLPIVKGFRRVGMREPEAVTEKALAVYPTVALLTHYPNLKTEGEEPEELQLAGNTVSAKLFKGSRVFKQTTSRSTNVASQWRSSDVPFGLAKFQVTLTREEKPLAASSEEFQRTSLIEQEMAVAAIGGDAHSELGDSK